MGKDSYGANACVSVILEMEFDVKCSRVATELSRRRTNSQADYGKVSFRELKFLATNPSVADQGLI